MNGKSFFVLAGATGLAVVLAVTSSMSWGTKDTLSERGRAFLPELAGKVGEIASIRVTEGDMKMTVRKDGDRFVDSSGYPVKRDAVRDLVASASVLAIDERKTADSARHADLDLASPDAERGAGKLVEFIDGNGDVLAGFMAGKADYSVGGVGGGVYVRPHDSDQTYLARGSIKLPYGRHGWFDNTLFETDREKIAAITIEHDGTPVAVVKRDGDRMLLEEMPDGKTLDENKVGRLTRLFANLSFSDVRAASDDPQPASRVLAVETGDGMVVKLAALEKSDDEGRWIRVVTGESEAAPESAQAKLAQKVEGFEFRLAAYDAEMFDWSVEDLLETPQS